MRFISAGARSQLSRCRGAPADGDESGGGHGRRRRGVDSGTPLSEHVAIDTSSSNM
jgi:hypothetical protein